MEHGFSGSSILQVLTLDYVILCDHTSFCEPSRPMQLFNDHAKNWCDDLKHIILVATEDQPKVMILKDVEDNLLPNNRTLVEFGLP